MGRERWGGRMRERSVLGTGHGIDLNSKQSILNGPPSNLAAFVSL